MKKEEFMYQQSDETREAVLTFLQSVNAEPEIIYAFEKTGLVVTEKNRSKLSEIDMRNWNDAIAEYYNPQ